MFRAGKSPSTRRFLGAGRDVGGTAPPSIPRRNSVHNDSKKCHEEARHAECHRPGGGVRFRPYRLQRPSPETGGDAQASAEITFLTFQSPNLTKEFWDKQVAEIQKEFPNLKVTFQYTPNLDYQGYAKQLLAMGNLPDVIWDVQLQDFVTAGALLPYDVAGLADIDAPDTAGLVEDKHYSLTLGAQVIPMIYYNKDVLEDLGIEVPTTYKELTAAAKTIEAAGLTPFLLGGGADTWASTIVLGGMITTDAVGTNPDWVERRKAGEVSFTDPEFASAVEKRNALCAAGYFNADALTIDYSQLSAKFAAGEGVM